MRNFLLSSYFLYFLWIKYWCVVYLNYGFCLSLKSGYEVLSLLVVFISKVLGINSKDKFIWFVISFVII
jgi:hypothetical protein